MISKAVRKMLAVSLAAVMAVGAMAGCGAKEDQGTTEPTKAPDQGTTEQGTTNQGTTEQGTADSSTTQEPEATPIPEAYVVKTDENGNPIDLGGIEIVIRDWWTTEYNRDRKTDYDEARWDYVEWLEETYNFTIREEGLDGWADMPQNFIDYATTGGDEHYIFTWRQCGEFVSALNAELMYDVASLDVFDFSQPKWSSNAHVLASKGDKILGFRGIEPEPRGCMYFNKRLLKEAGIDPESIYDLQEKGEWTWAKFEEICEKVQRDLDNDGVTDIYALVHQDAEFYQSAVVSNGGSFIGKDANGKFVNNLESKETMEALNWAKRMQDTYLMPNPTGDPDNWEYFVPAFKEGKGVFFTDQVYRGSQMINDEARLDEYGMVCFPYNQNNPNRQTYYTFYNDNIYAIPACYDEDKAWKIAFAYDLYTNPVPEFEDYSGYSSGQYQNFCDTESIDESMALLLQHGDAVYHSLVNGIDLGNHVFWKIGTTTEDGKVMTPADAAEAIRNTWQTYIDETNNK